MNGGMSSRIPIKKEDIIFRKIEDEYILVPMLSTSDEVENIYNLNQVGADIWERIDGEKTIGEVIEELKREYEGNPEEIERDVFQFVGEIHSAGIIRFREDEGD